MVASRKHYFPVPPQVGQVILPTPEHLGHSFPFTFLAPLHIGHDIVFWPLQDLQLICHLSFCILRFSKEPPVVRILGPTPGFRNIFSFVWQCGMADASVQFIDKNDSAQCPPFATIRVGCLRPRVSSLPAALARRLRRRIGHGGG